MKTRNGRVVLESKDYAEYHRLREGGRSHKEALATMGLRETKRIKKEPKSRDEGYALGGSGMFDRHL